ncbi:MAG: hypothetical protein JWP03_594 [Phycisphaerales bacterium]|jgi:hypothetical protein|nr:hypothetical protein [Phycisphaerales bacterium]
MTFEQPAADVDALQALCELGQEQLIAMQYLESEATLARAEHIAWAARDWDSLSRLYLPLQEARRQRRQRSGEGIVCLDLLADGPDDRLEALHVVQNFSHGQLLVAGWGSIEPAVRVRELAAEHELYLDTFLAAIYPAGDGRVVAIIPTDDVRLPDPAPRPIEDLIRLLPEHSIVLRESELPEGSRRGTFETYAQVMALWERLHKPFLAAADAQSQPMGKIEGYRKTIDVDYASELAHQRLSDVARGMLKNH